MADPYRTPADPPSPEPSALDLLDSLLYCPVTVDCPDCRDFAIARTGAVDGHHEMCPRVRHLKR